VKDCNSRAPGKLRLSTQVPHRPGFLRFDHDPLTVAILSPLTIAACRLIRPVKKRRRGIRQSGLGLAVAPKRFT